MKTEPDAYDQAQCFSCLSVGRKMLCIGEYSATFRVLVPEGCSQVMTPIENMKLCWECYSLLSKAENFRCRVLKAMDILQNGQNTIHETLSSLTTVTNNDIESHTTYVIEYLQIIKENESSEDAFDTVHYDSPLQEDMKEDNESLKDAFDTVHYDSPLQEDMKEDIESLKDAFDTVHYDSPLQEDMKEDPKIEIIVPMMVKTEIKECVVNNSTKASKWALKRAKENRKPKFCILRAKDLKVEMLFRKERKLTSKLTRCRNCNLDFENDIDLMKHYRNIHEKEFVCDLCNDIFSDKVQFSAHLTCHDMKYECMLCNCVCSNEFRSYNHVMKCHRRVFECLKCLKKFVSRREFYQHYKEWHEKFVCDYCGISFKMRYCIKDHIRKQHAPLECRPCNKRFARYNGLWLHNKLRHGPPGTTAYCVECDKSFPDIYRYRWHLANSTKHKPRKKVSIPCPECDKVFTKNIYMKDHYNLVHLKQYKYRCEVCDKNYIRNADLVKHKRRVHEGILPPKNKICYYCGRGFSTNKILANHLRTHTGERPFLCTVCPARFAQRAALVGHTRAIHHSGEKKKRHEKNDV